MKSTIVGWSQAAFNTRELQLAKVPYPLLFSGEYGTFVEPIAKRFTKPKQGIVDLDTSSSQIGPTTVAISNCSVDGLHGESAPMDLGTLHRLSSKTRRSNASLRTDLAGIFRRHFRQPPLCERLIDVLAWLHAYGKSVEGRQLRITPRTIYAFLCDTEWPGNDRLLLQTIHSLVDGRTKTIDLPPGGEVRFAGEHPNYQVLDGFLYSPATKAKPSSTTKWHCRDDYPPISLADLPQVTLRMYFAAFLRSLDDPSQADRAEKPFNALGEPENWIAFESMPLTRDQIRKSTEQELLTHFSYGLCPEVGWNNAIIDKLNRFRFLGSSLQALRTNIGESQGMRCRSLIEQATGQTNNRKAAQADDKALEKLTPKQLEAVQLYFIDGLKMEDIGKQLGVSKQAVNKRIKTACEKYPDIEREMTRAKSQLRRHRLEYEQDTQNDN